MMTERLFALHRTADGLSGPPVVCFQTHNEADDGPFPASWLTVWSELCILAFQSPLSPDRLGEIS